MVINHPLNKVQDFPGGGWVFVGKRLWICMMNTNHLEGRVFSTDYVGIDTYLSCWILWATLRELFRTYPASSRNRKMIFQKGGDILVPGRVVLNQATRSLKWRQLKAQNWKEKKSTTQLYHLESRWRSPRNIGFRQSAWGHSTCGHLHHHDEYNEYKVPTASRWSNDQGLQALHDLGNNPKWNQRLVYLPKFTAWKLNSSPLKIYRAPKGSRLVFQASIFRCYITSRRCHPTFSWFLNIVNSVKLYETCSPTICKYVGRNLGELFLFHQLNQSKQIPTASCK